MPPSKKGPHIAATAAPPAKTSAPQRFRAVIRTLGKKASVELPFDPNLAWGEKDRHYVAGTIQDCRIRGLVASDGDHFVISLGPAWLRDNAPAIGTAVEVVLEPEAPLIEGLASDIAMAIGSDREAKRFFESVAPFYRKNAIRWIESAKRPETRASRIAEVVGMLRAGKTMG